MTEKTDGYVQKIKAKLEEWKAEIDALAARADQAEGDAKIECHRRIGELRAKRAEFEEKLSELEQAGEGAWDDFKQGLENSWDILKTSFSRAKSEFERGYREGREE